MFRNWKIRRMLKKGFQSISVPEKEKVLPESVTNNKEKTDIHYSVQNNTIKSKYRKITAFAKIAVTAVLIVSLLTVMALNLNQKPGSLDETSSDILSESQGAINTSSDSSHANSNSQSATSKPFNPPIDPTNEDILKNIKIFCAVFDMKLPMTDEELARVAKFVKFKDYSTVYDKGINLRCDNYNSKIISYGTNDVSVSYGSVYSKNQGLVEFCSVNIGSGDTSLNFPLDIKYGDSLEKVLNALQVTDKYLQACNNFNLANTSITLMKSTLWSDLLTLTFKEDDNKAYASFKGDLTITYTTNENINLLNIERENFKYEMRINITSGKVSSYCISIISEDKNSKIDVDTSKDLTFYYDNNDYIYNKETGVYAKVSSITINNQRAIITYKAYADYNTTAAIDFVVTENSGVKNQSHIYQDITTKEKEYTVTINNCFEKRIDLKIADIGYNFQPYDSFILLKCESPSKDVFKEDKFGEEVLSAFYKFYKSIGFPDYVLDYTEEQLKEKAQAIQFTDNKTLFDYGVYLHYDNYNGNGIVYGKEYNKIGYEKYDRGLKTYLMISEETRNIDYPFNFRVGTSLQEVLEKLHFIDQYKYNENNNIYEYVDGFEVAKTFNIYINDKTNDYFNKAKESLQLKYHTDNLEVTDKSLEKGNVTIQYVKESFINYNTVTNTVELIFKEGKLKYINVGYNIILDSIIPYDSSKSISFHFENNDYSYSSETGIYAKLKTIEVSGKTLKITFKTKTDADKKCDISVMLLASLDLVIGNDYTTIDIQAGEHEYTYSYTVTKREDNNPLTFDGRINIGGNQLDFNLHSSRISQTMQSSG